MKKEQTQTISCFMVPEHLLEGSGLEQEDALYFHVTDGCVLATKSQMTAMDTVTLVESLSRITVGLLTRLVNATDPCDQCFPNCWERDEPVTIPSRVLMEAGIPSDAKLDAKVSDNDGILVSQAPYRYDLHDVSEDLQLILAESGACLMQLDELLAGEAMIIDFDVDDLCGERAT